MLMKCYHTRHSTAVFWLLGMIARQDNSAIELLTVEYSRKIAEKKAGRRDFDSDPRASFRKKRRGEMAPADEIQVPQGCRLHYEKRASASFRRRSREMDSMRRAASFWSFLRSASIFLP